MMDDNIEPVNYCGASSGHVIASRFKFKRGEPLKLFGRSDIDDTITWLDLSDCTGVVDSSTFSLLPGLEYIYIDNCKFEQWESGVFTPIETLDALNITNSQFSINQTVFEGAGNLETLSLSDFDKIQNNSFITLQKLKSLTFEKCKFGEVSKELFTGLQELNYLRIAYCEINHVAVDAFDNLENLEIFMLTENKIGSLELDSFLKMNNLTDLSIHDNICGFDIDYSFFTKLPKLTNILFEKKIYQDLDFDSFPSLKKVNIPDNSDEDNLDAVIQKLEAKNIEFELVLVGKIKVDMSKVQICG